ncbi:MAG: hypothetical protein ACPGJV_05160 [Bacteriovoracaceae bacterium]
MILCTHSQNEINCFYIKFENQEILLTPSLESTLKDSHIILTSDQNELGLSECLWSPLVFERTENELQDIIDTQNLGSLSPVQLSKLAQQHHLENVYSHTRLLQKEFVSNRDSFIQSLGQILSLTLMPKNMRITYRGIAEENAETPNFELRTFNLSELKAIKSENIEKKIFEAYQYTNSPYECLGFKTEENGEHMGYISLNLNKNPFIIKLEGISSLSSLQELYLKTFARTLHLIAKEFAPKAKRKAQPVPSNAQDVRPS